jgi:hypothetical protein
MKNGLNKLTLMGLASRAKFRRPSAIVAEGIATSWRMQRVHLRRAMAGALQHAKISVPGTHGLPVLVGQNP